MSTADIFKQCIDDALQRSDALIRDVVRQVIASLEQQAEQAASSRDRQLFADMALALRQSEKALAAAFVDRFAEVLDAEVQGRPQPRDEAAPALSQGLSLMDDATLEEGVEVSRLTHLLEAESQWEVRDLGARLDSLRSDEGGPTRANPLRPEVFSRSLHHALAVVPVDAEERNALLRAFGKGMSAALKETYAVYNKRLADLQVEPRQYRARPAARAAGVRPAATAGGEEAAAGRGEATAAAAGAEFNIEALQQALMGRAAAALDAAGALADGGFAPSGFAPSGFGPTGAPNSTFGRALALDPRLRDALDRLLLTDRLGLRDVRLDADGASAPVTNLIDQHRAALYEAASRPLERLTIDVVSLLFDHILADERLLPAVKAQLARLQIPVLRLGLRDATLFSSRNHPTRKLLNRVAEYSAGFSSADEPAAQRFLPALARMVEAIINSDEDDAGIYQRQLDDLQRHIAESAAVQEQQQAVAVDALRRAEFRSLLHGALYHHLQGVFARLHTHVQLRDFMLEHWSTVLAESVLRYGEDADTTQAYKQTASDLIWSVQPKTAEADRKTLVKLLPLLVRRLGEGLDLIALPPERRQEFFSWLMQAHAQAVRGQGPEQHDVSRDDALLLQREWARLLHGTQRRPAAEAALPEAVVRPDEKTSSGLIESADLPEAPEAQGEAAAEGEAANPSAGEVALLSPAEVQQLIAGLDIGSWVQLQIQGRSARAQLTWRSPQGLFYMFSSKVGGRAHSMTRRALERMAAQGLILPLQAEGLMDRAMQGVADQLRQQQAAAGEVLGEKAA